MLFVESFCKYLTYEARSISCSCCKWDDKWQVFFADLTHVDIKEAAQVFLASAEKGQE